MSEAFYQAAEEAKVLKIKPDKSELTFLYGLYKQATLGDVNIDQPGLFSFPGRMKWNAWNEWKGLTKDEAETEYINLVEKLKVKYGI